MTTPLTQEHSSHPNQSKPTDVVVVGAGLAGLTAAVTAARRGKTVRVLERLPRAGGLCGTFELDGHTFVRACNEFGGGVADTLGALGVPVTFRRSRARVLLPEGALNMPAGLTDAPRFLRHASGLLDAVRQGRKASALTLYDAVKHRAGDPWVRSLAAFVSAAAATPPDRIPLSDLGAFARAGYGWHRPVKVVGGPGALVAGLVQAAQSHGARFDFGVAVEQIDFERPGSGATGGVHHVRTSTGEVLVARHVLTSAPRWDQFPAHAAEGLFYGTALVVLRDDLPFPEGTSTLHYVPPGALETMVGLGRGEASADFPFILTRPIDPAPAGGRTLVAFFATPQGTRDFSDAQRVAIREHLVTTVERSIPGFGRAIASLRVVSPMEFEAIHGLPACGMARMPPPQWSKPEVRDPVTHLVHLGVSVGPPGADGAAAVFSGRRAAELACA